MYAAMKGTVIEAVIFGGDTYVTYPSWYEELLEEADEDGFGNLIIPMLNENEDAFDAFTLTPWDSVILRNRHGDIHHVTAGQFGETFHPMGPFHAARKDDCVEYYKYSSYSKVRDLPDWIRELIHDEGFIVMEFEVVSLYATHHNDGDPLTMVTNDSYFIRNRMGQVRHMYKDEFEKRYYVPYPKYI